MAGVRLLLLDRTEKHNALNLAMRDELSERIDMSAQDSDVRVVVIAANGSNFSVGGDIVELGRRTIADIQGGGSQAPFAAIDRCPKPILVAVHGYVLGGGWEIALRCDIVLAGKGARFALPEARIGIMAGSGGNIWVSRTSGTKQSLPDLWAGTTIDARTAHARGMVSELVSDAVLRERALALAGAIAGLPPWLAAKVKHAVACAA